MLGCWASGSSPLFGQASYCSADLIRREGSAAPLYHRPSRGFIQTSPSYGHILAFRGNRERGVRGGTRSASGCLRRFTLISSWGPSVSLSHIRCQTERKASDVCLPRWTKSKTWPVSRPVQRIPGKPRILLGNQLLCFPFQGGALTYSYNGCVFFCGPSKVVGFRFWS